MPLGPYWYKHIMSAGPICVLVYKTLSRITSKLFDIFPLISVGSFTFALTNLGNMVSLCFTKASRCFVGTTKDLYNLSGFYIYLFYRTLVRFLRRWSNLVIRRMYGTIEEA